MSTKDFLIKYKDLFNKEYIKELKLSDSEKQMFFPIIMRIVEEQNKCDELPDDVCINENFSHTRLIRDKNKNLVVIMVPCSKQKKLNNYVFDDFAEIDKKNLSMVKLCNSLVDEMWSNLPAQDTLDTKLSYSEKFKIIKKQKNYTNSKLQIINSFLTPAFKTLKKDKDISKVKGIYIYGSYGVGKTLLMHTFLNSLLDEGFKGIFIKTSTLSKKLKSNFDKSNYINEKIVDRCKNVDVLVLDDIGVSDTNEWFVNQILFEILDERYNAKKLTYFTSNFSMNQLFKKIRNSSKLPAIDVGRIIDRIKALTNNTEIEIKEINHRYLNYK